MIYPKSNSTPSLKQTHWEIALCVFVTFAIAYLMVHGYHFQLIVLVLLGSCILAAYRFPILTVLTLIVLAVLPPIFHMLPGYSEDWANLGGGVRIQDAILISMVGAVFLKLFFRVRDRTPRNKLGISLFAILFGLWILFEIARNVGMYGLSAPGEFRFRYLILSAPLYIYFYFPAEEQRKKLFKTLIFCSLVLPILCVPIIGNLKGWSVGAHSRFLSSSISLGLLYGVMALSVGKKYGLLRVNGALYWFLTISVGLLILFDTHRSVWLSGVVVAVTFFALKEIPSRKIMKWSSLIFMSLLLVYAVASKFIASNTGTTPVGFVLERSSDIVKFGDEYNTTASWRVARWKMEMQKFYAAPIAGVGFGGYWGFSGEALSPHSLYVQTLVKMGAVGMLLYFMIVLTIFNKFRRAITRYRVRGDQEIAILITGLVVLVASHAFYTVYAFEYYSLLFIGLGVASLRDQKFAL